MVTTTCLRKEQGIICSLTERNTENNNKMLLYHQYFQIYAHQSVVHDKVIVLENIIIYNCRKLYEFLISKSKMKKNRKKTITLLVLGFGLTTAHAQQAVTAAGGNASGSGGTSAFSVGQALYTTQNGSNGSVAQGVQQPYEISILLGIEEVQIGLNLMVSPNPTTDYLTLSLGALASDSEQSMNLQLYDFNGSLIETRKIKNSTETIVMQHLPSATYFLTITNKNTAVKTFKIIKN